MNDQVRIEQAFGIFQKENIVDFKKNRGNIYMANVLLAVHLYIAHTLEVSLCLNDFYVEEETAERRIPCIL